MLLFGGVVVGASTGEVAQRLKLSPMRIIQLTLVGP